MQRIREVFETESIVEANERLQKEWVLLLVCNTPKGALYVLGRRNKTEDVESQTTDMKDRLKELIFGEIDAPDTALSEVLNYAKYLVWKRRQKKEVR